MRLLLLYIWTSDGQHCAPPTCFAPATSLLQRKVSRSKLGQQDSNMTLLEASHNSSNGVPPAKLVQSANMTLLEASHNSSNVVPPEKVRNSNMSLLEASHNNSNEKEEKARPNNSNGVPPEKSVRVDAKTSLTRKHNLWPSLEAPLRDRVAARFTTNMPGTISFICFSIWLSFVVCCIVVCLPRYLCPHEKESEGPKPEAVQKPAA